MSEEITKHSCWYNYDAKTDIECINVKWTFLRFSEIITNRKFYISPFSPESEFQLELEFYIEEGRSIWICATNMLEKSITFDIYIVILDENGKELHGERKREATVNAKPQYVSLLSGTHSTLNHQLRSCPNDTVIIDLKFLIKNTKPWYQDLYHCNSGKELTEDLKKFILEILPSEVILKTKDDKIPFNKAILSARSPVFKKMFSHPTSEQVNNIILIDDLMGSTVRKLVDFLYSGEVDLKIEFRYLKELYYAADKYGVLDLQDLCAANILPRLTVKNWREVLELSREHSDEHLEKGCMIFIGRHIATFVQTKDYEELKCSEPDLAIQIFERYFKGVPNMI